ncbi:MAG TPA: lytic transglycosylase domain-containing protein [Ktedonobacteraceae bacterium]|nr:lytic transglycosylase domain-containing protein [Ktedonobacteraceae bacterium]
MQNMNNIQPTGSIDVRNSGKKISRVRMALASTGLAGAVLMGGLIGTHMNAPAAHAHATKHSTAYTVTSTNPSQMTTVPVSYSVSNDYVSIARQAATSAGINPDLFVRQIQQESGFNPGAVSPAGAVGIAQFMPTTAAGMGVNPYDPTSALYGGARLMAQLSNEFGGNYAKALAAYNAGPGAVIAAQNQGGANWLSFCPAESQNYVHIIMG